jgi:hypothetical protein
MTGGVEICLGRTGTEDAIDRVGLKASTERSLWERKAEELRLAREMMLASENASCKLICEVFRISFPESFMRGLNIAITCCDQGVQWRMKRGTQMVIPLSMPNCPGRTIGTRGSVDVSVLPDSEHPEGLLTQRRDYTSGT